MNNLEVLKKSLKNLAGQPKLFLPRIVSSLISSAFLILVLNDYTSGNQLSTSAVTASFGGMYLLSIISLFVWLMLVSMVKNNSGLKKGFSEAAHNIGKLLKAATALLLIGVLIALPSSIGIVFYSQGIIWAGIVGPAITLVLMFFLSYTSYFVPVTLLDTEGVLKSWKKSYAGSKEKRTAVISLTVLSFILLGVSLWFSSSTVVKSFGQAGFIIGRILSSVVTTYLMVLSPELYLD
ncbi:MAG: hypothetical protein H8Z69_05060 [Nanohaloarchaea archaeon]|nr:hypothetical protein [Candidatus Nanohaloarchaea archaeon]